MERPAFADFPDAALFLEGQKIARGGSVGAAQELLDFVVRYLPALRYLREYLVVFLLFSGLESEVGTGEQVARLLRKGGRGVGTGSGAGVGAGGAGASVGGVSGSLGGACLVELVSIGSSADAGSGAIGSATGSGIGSDGGGLIGSFAGI
ncbi:hypothetical protein A2765_03545 [Candidatus Kaiserbacteria bacterium RIFCSPHIGHO2_01_FULL_56_24]|uniref:Uncharacterized protein n=1 Tax=Candidatus Kaiserbacteria bacterium RIFCSPHIGHO2_01_FULL_56_24 TaxID=1798487 RepID=A0A1F6DGU6_9BACT|nr:MAG: hypothetical protein A2765_03545 [Candidatus Kaiserbacteria bacterium RIFCSPHIGHO2_01_FULL_56_24]